MKSLTAAHSVFGSLEGLDGHSFSPVPFCTRNISRQIEEVQRDSTLDPETKQNRFIKLYESNKGVLNAENSAVLLDYFCNSMLHSDAERTPRKIATCIELARTCVSKELGRAPELFCLMEAVHSLALLKIPAKEIFAEAASHLVRFKRLSPCTLENIAWSYVESHYRPTRLFKHLALSACRSADRFDIDDLAGITAALGRANFSHDRFHFIMGDRLWEILKGIHKPGECGQSIFGQIALGFAPFDRTLGRAVWDTLTDKYEELYPPQSIYEANRDSDPVVLQQLYETGLALGCAVRPYMAYATFEKSISRGGSCPSHSRAERDIAPILDDLKERFHIDVERNHSAGGYVVDFLVTFEHRGKEIKIALDITGKTPYVVEDPISGNEVENGLRKIRRLALENLGYDIVEVEKTRWNELSHRDKRRHLERTIGSIISEALS